MADASSVDFRALQLFIAVYDNQSFSVVARREGVSPSLISRTIQQLEDALGQQLFYRNTRAVVPTEAGRLFAASARELLGQYADAQRALQDRAQVPADWCGSMRRSILVSGISPPGFRNWRPGIPNCSLT
ncbi:LysR family transcriptional regulator [Klebsiella pneumoniae]|nr:LysR family transcriptional regulator [Klebsiella pneumoniae]